MNRQHAIRELDRYAEMTMRHSLHQYSKHGTLHDVALRAFDAPDLWKKPWVPADFDIGRAQEHPIFLRFSSEQKLAWNHLQWGLEYTVVGQGERQIITLNNYAVRRYRHILPSVVALEQRESFEEVDHLAAFQVGLDALRERYFPNRSTALWSRPASGFSSNRANKVLRHAIGVLADRLLGTNFPTLFFLTRGIKTHNFKPFENAIAQFQDAPSGVAQVSHLHRLDESRHMATALQLARLSNHILEQQSVESRQLLKAAVHAAWPKDRMADYRIAYWNTVLKESPLFASLTLRERSALQQHIASNIRQGLQQLHHRQQHLTRQANKRIVELASLSPKLKRAFVDALRDDPVHANLVDAVEL